MGEANTIFIYDSCGQESIRFFIKDGDFSHLNDIYVGLAENEEKQNELSALLETDITMLDTFPVNKVNRQTKVVVVGYIP